MPSPVGLKFIGKGLSKRIREMAKKLPQIVDEELLAIAGEMVQDFEKTTASWTTPVTFVETEVKPHQYGVVTDSQIWKWVNEGVPPHVIYPVNQEVLIFQSGYRPKTSVGRIGSGPGGRSGDKLSAFVVNHPGIDAREFSATILERWQPKVGPRVRKRLNEGIEAIGL